jgi:hypothetical protein
LALLSPSEKKGILPTKFGWNNRTCAIHDPKTPCKKKHYFLVGGLEHFLFSPIVGRMIQSDWYFSKGLKPPISFGVHDTYETYRNSGFCQQRLCSCHP